MLGEDRVEAMAAELYEIWRQSALETGWYTICPKMSWQQQAEGIRQLWRRVALRAAHLYAQETHAH